MFFKCKSAKISKCHCWHFFQHSGHAYEEWTMIRAETPDPSLLSFWRTWKDARIILLEDWNSYPSSPLRFVNMRIILRIVSSVENHILASEWIWSAISSRKLLFYVIVVYFQGQVAWTKKSWGAVTSAPPRAQLGDPGIKTVEGSGWGGLPWPTIVPSMAWPWVHGTCQRFP